MNNKFIIKNILVLADLFLIDKNQCWTFRTSDSNWSTSKFQNDTLIKRLKKFEILKKEKHYNVCTTWDLANLLIALLLLNKLRISSTVTLMVLHHARCLC